MNSIRKWLRLLTYTNSLIALAAVAQCGLTYLIVDLPIQPYILVIEGASTLLLYNFSLFLSKPANPQSSPYPRTRFFFKREREMWGISVAAGFLLLYAVTQIHLMTLVFLGCIGVLSFLYNVPIFFRRKSKGGLRQVPGLKLFYIAVLWSLSTVGLPVVEAWSEGSTIPWLVANYLGVIKVLFLIICTLPFDIRDMKQDLHYGLKTLPLMIGEIRSTRLTYMLLIAHTISVMAAPYSLLVKVGLLLTNVWVFLVLKGFFNHKNSYQRVYLLDVALILQYIITVGILCTE